MLRKFSVHLVFSPRSIVNSILVSIERGGTEMDEQDKGRIKQPLFNVAETFAGIPILRVVKDQGAF